MEGLFSQNVRFAPKFGGTNLFSISAIRSLGYHTYFEDQCRVVDADTGNTIVVGYLDGSLYTMSKS
jgi:hypothetical protein